MLRKPCRSVGIHTFLSYKLGLACSYRNGKLCPILMATVNFQRVFCSIISDYTSKIMNPKSLTGCGCTG